VWHSFIKYRNRQSYTRVFSGIRGDPTVPDRYKVFFTDRTGRKIEVYLSISPLTKPSDTCLAVSELIGLIEKRGAIGLYWKVVEEA
jgi:hypothetical protein